MLMFEWFDRGRAMEAIKGYKNLVLCYKFIFPKVWLADCLSLLHTAVPLGNNSGTDMLEQYGDFGTK